MRRLLCLLAIVGCAATPMHSRGPCITRCGIIYHGTASCQGLQYAETKINRILADNVVGWTEPMICAAENGWTVNIHAAPTSHDNANCPDDSWLEYEDTCVIGYTRIEIHTIDVMNSNWLHNAMAHEIVHIVDYSSLGHSGHTCWDVRGIKSALKEITGVSDETPGEEECQFTPSFFDLDKL